MSAVLRPGRFLGNHYIAFTVPERSVIITMDRVKEGIRVARQNKRAADAALKLAQAEALADERSVGAYTGINYDKTAKKAKVDALKFKDPDDKSRDDSNTKTDEADKKGFLNKFVKGYINATMSDRNKEQRTAKLSLAISEWFGMQELGSYFDDKSK